MSVLTAILAPLYSWTLFFRFKLHLRPKQSEKDGADPVPPLPANMKIEEVFADYLRYLNKCALRFIEHAHGADMWTSLSSNLSPAADADGRYPVGQGTIYVLSHPNGWEGYHQQVYSKGATMGGLLPDNAECLYERLQFVTEGEASLHWASSTLGSSASMKVLWNLLHPTTWRFSLILVLARNWLHCHRRWRWDYRCEFLSSQEEGKRRKGRFRGDWTSHLCVSLYLLSIQCLTSLRLLSRLRIRDRSG